MKKTKEEKLAEYKKANQERRERIAEREGYSNSTEYLNYLTGTRKVVKNTKKTITKSKTKIDTIHNVYILDASGSMRGSKLDNAIKGINSEIKELKKDNKFNYTQSIVSFSGSEDIKFMHYLVGMKHMVPYYDTARGMTALNDAIGVTLEKLQKSKTSNSKVLVKIFTDGEENDSRRFTPQKISKLIKECEANGFTIAFVGTKEEVNYAINNYNVNFSNTLTHNNTSADVTRAFKMSAQATSSYTTSVAAGEDVKENFFTKKVGKL